MGNFLWKTFVRGVHKMAGLDSPYSQQEYGKNWTKQRQNCLERDGYACRICETHTDEIGREPSVHHITPRSEFADDDWREYNSLDNLIALCPSCHGKFEGEYVDCSPSEFAEQARQSNT